MPQIYDLPISHLFPISHLPPTISHPMTVRTTRCQSVGHREVALEADVAQVPAGSLHELAATIEELVLAGSVFHPGETFQVGWMLTRIMPVDDRTLTLHEPDFANFPPAFVPSVTQTLRTMMLQVFMLDSVGLKPEMKTPSMTDGAMVCTNLEHDRFMMHRFAPRSAADSGWYIGCLREDHDHEDPANIQVISLYEAVLRKRTIESFLTFPEECTIYMGQAEGLKLTRYGKPLTVRQDSFLDRLHKRTHL